MQWLNYHHLYYFYTIAREGSVTLATKKTKLAQSTLSAQLKQFEDSIGYQLFERRNRRLFLTDVGRKVFDYAHEIFSLGDELRSSVTNFEQSLKVAFRVGVMDSVPKQLSQEIIRIAAGEMGAKVSVTEELLSSLLLRLANHELDLILANDRPSTGERNLPFHVKLIGELKIVIVTHPSRESLAESFPRSLDGQPFILPGEQSALRREVVDHFRVKRIQPLVLAEVDDLELQKSLVLNNFGSAALPYLSVKKEIESGELLCLSETPICHENLWLISAHRLVHNPIAKVLLEKFRSSD